MRGLIWEILKFITCMIHTDKKRKEKREKRKEKREKKIFIIQGIRILFRAQVVARYLASFSQLLLLLNPAYRETGLLD